MKISFKALFGAAGAAAASAFGGWDSALTTLLILMGIDYIAGLLTAGLFHNSPKTESGLLDSGAGWRGLAKKGMVLLFVLVGARLDLVMGTAYIRDAVCIAYIANEVLSIVENAGRMGVPIPEALANAVEMLKTGGRKGT